MATQINTPDAVPNELITAAWGDAVRGDLNRLNANKVEATGDSMTGMLILPSTNPTNANHAARKGYVDAQVATSVRDNVTANQTMRGPLTAPHFVATANPLPTGNNVVVNREVLQAGLAGRISRNGDTMGGILQLASQDATGPNAAMRREWIVNYVQTQIDALRDWVDANFQRK